MSPTLLSLNVGLPREIRWEGKVVRTAIWKEPVEGPRMARRLNVDGDDQADRLAHGGEHRAVFVYQIDSYRYWERELGRDDFSLGQFGENFTVEGLADDEVCIGDRYRVGAALFEVTQPRVTCYRVGIRMGNPAMPSLLVAHHRPGFYLRVLEEGPVQAGDAIVKVADGAEGLTIAQVDALLYLPNKSRLQLERALRIPALSEGWKQSFQELIAKFDAEAKPPAWAGFRPLRVGAIRRESATITSFWLSPTDEVPPVRARARASTSPCVCNRPRSLPCWCAATRCLTSPTSAATESASSVRVPGAATCTNTSRSATSSTPRPRGGISFSAAAPARSCSSAPAWAQRRLVR